MSRIEKQQDILRKLRDSFSRDILDITAFKGDVTVLVERKAVLNVCNYLKDDPSFRMNYLVDVLAVDHMPRSPRFDVIYCLYSIPKKQRIRVKTMVAEGESAPSVTGIWLGADWPEREAYDMFGIVFEGHPDLSRIYLPDDWEGFPLRKDYPLRGYKDRYNPYGEEKE